MVEDISQCEFAELQALRVQIANVSCVLMCSRANVPCVLTCSPANVPCVPTYSRAIASNNKNKFSMACFNKIFGTFSLSSSYEVKLYMKSARQARMSLETFILRMQ